MHIKLNVMERVKLLEIIPPSGNRLNIKILRRLRETLSLTEAELNQIPVRYEFRCMHQLYDKDDTLTGICNQRGYFSDMPTCPEHKESMQGTGNFQILNAPILYSLIKEVHLGNEAVKIVREAYKVLDNANQRDEFFDILYDKLFPEDEEEKD